MTATIAEGEVEGHPVWTLSAPGGEVEATFAVGAGMVGCSLRHRGQELLAQRKGLDAYARTGSTVGIPLLAPWANRLDAMSFRVAGRQVTLADSTPGLRPDEAGLPIHGLLGGSPEWELVDAEADATHARLAARLDFGARAERLDAFPFPHVLEQEVALGEDGLSIATTLVAGADADVPVSFGYHPYLQLPGAARPEWELTLPVRRRARLDERGIPTGESEPVYEASGPLGRRTFDDLFDELEEPAQFAVAAAGRSLTVSFDQGYPFAQVYAPDESDFICFEPMTAPTNALVSGDRLTVVPAGDAYRAQFTVAVGSTG